MDSVAAQARARQRAAEEYTRLAAQVRGHRDQLVRRLRESDPQEWTYQRIARAVEITPALVAAIVQGRTPTITGTELLMPVSTSLDGTPPLNLGERDRAFLATPDLARVIPVWHGETATWHARAQGIHPPDDPGHALLGVRFDQPVTVTTLTLTGDDTGRVYAGVSRRTTPHEGDPEPWVHSWFVGVGSPAPFGTLFAGAHRPGHPVIRRVTVRGLADDPVQVDTTWWPTA